jgi:hypothetical protein
LSLFIADKIRQYFGVKIGMYFAFLGHYTMWLTLPSVLGVSIWLLQGTNQVRLFLFQFDTGDIRASLWLYLHSMLLGSW